MTLVLGLRCRDGIVLAADSQRTQGAMRDRVPKLFASPAGILWGTAGNIAIQQELDAGMRDLTVGRHPSAIDGKAAILAAIQTREHARRQPSHHRSGSQRPSTACSPGSARRIAPVICCA